MGATRAAVAAVLIFMATGAAGAADPPPGATSCSGCHATRANVDTPVPRLVGRDAADIAVATTAFRSGQRAGTVMDRIAKGFSDDEVRAIAAWLAAQR